MNRSADSNVCPSASRRRFLQGSAAAVGSAVAGSLLTARSAHAAGDDRIRVGLIGCGGRGSGAAVNAMNAGKDVQLVAVADLFEDRLRSGLERLRTSRPEQVSVADENAVFGFDAYRKVIDADVDVVILAAASHFHPEHFQAAVDAGKHVFFEKPHGIDVPGVKRCMAVCEEARRKNLCVVSGLCWRYDLGVRETIRRVLDGAIGEIVAIQENYLTRPYGLNPRQEGWSELEYQFRNWYHFNWLSGDQTSQQLIHSIDKASWALGDRPPLKVIGLGGRQTCLDPQYGDQFDHQSAVFEYEGGARVFGFCRDQPGCYNQTADIIMGTKGRAFLPRPCRIEGEVDWQYDGPLPSMYDVEHQELFDAIRAGKPINNGDYMFTSTMLGIMAQMACYTGQEVTWEQAMKSTVDFSLERYAWDVDPPVKPGQDGRYPTAMPGITPLA